MERASERRQENRIAQNGTIMVTDQSADYFIYAQIGNVSGSGMYFESEQSFLPGNEIQIRYDNPPFKSLPKKYHAKVQWCRRLSESESMLSFGIGAKYM